MRAILATYGTTGDIQPFLALAVELDRRGHSVRIGAPPDFEPRATKLGLDFFSLGPRIDLDELREVYGRVSLTTDTVKHVLGTLPLAIRDTPRMVRELTGACVGADVLVSHSFQLAGRIVHEVRGVPFVSVHLSPFGGYSRRFASESSRLINELRSSYGLGTLRDALGLDGSSPALALYAVSSALCRRPKHWPPHHLMTGFFFLDDPWVPAPELEEFMSEGERPLVISFGSVLHQCPEDLSNIVLDAIARTGHRAVVQRGWTRIGFPRTVPNVFLVDFIPHDWLFPRAACVVHAGGAGTTAAALRAGAPSVVVPHVLDQFWWAILARERGCAADVVPYSELSAGKLQRAIESALAPACRAASLSASEYIKRETGVENAANLIENIVKH